MASNCTALLPSTILCYARENLREDQGYGKVEGWNRLADRFSLIMEEHVHCEML